LKISRAVLSAGMLASSVLFVMDVRADEDADFYRANRMTMLIGSSAGDGTDLYGRLVAKYMSKKLPSSPQFLSTNVPGANGLIAANQLYNLSPKDGATLGTFSRYAPFEALWNNPSARFKPERFNWIGNVNVDVSVCITWHTAHVASLADFMSRDLKIGVTNESHVNILNNLFGAKLKAIKGYPGGNEINLALERGEVDGRCNISWSVLASTNREWLRDRKVDIQLQFSRHKLDALANVPMVTDLATTDLQKQVLDLVLVSQMIARVIVAPPEVPAARVALLRKAFDDAMRDPDFLDEAARIGAPVDPVSGRDIQEMITQMFRTSPDVVQRFQEMVGGKL
jgi:tripartite-type tricarboxylate transporter receptor subunit TctC